MGLSSPDSGGGKSIGNTLLGAVTDRLPITSALMGAVGIHPGGQQSQQSWFDPTSGGAATVAHDAPVMELPDYSAVSAQGAQPKQGGLSTILKLLAGI